MSMKTENTLARDFRRQMLRNEFRSLFWAVFSDRKRKQKFTLQAFANKLGIGKSSLSRGFNEPQNWTIDKLSDMAEALGVELKIEARDVASGVVYGAAGAAHVVATASTFGVLNSAPGYQPPPVSGRPVTPIRVSQSVHYPMSMSVQAA